MNIIIFIAIGLIGASIGSFLSVVISRINKGEKGIFLGRSKCTMCKRKLTAKDLIPVLSYILLKGKCRYCKKNITGNYPAIEIMTALLFLATYSKFQFIPEPAYLIPFIIYAIYGTFFVAIFFYDLQFSQIPDLFLFPLIAFGVIGNILLGSLNFTNHIIAILIALTFFGGQILISKGRWLGEGDLYLAIGLGIILGWKLFIAAIIISYFIGAIISVFLLLSKKVNKKSQVPFGPFLILGTLASIFFGDQIINWYINLITY